MPVHIQYVVRIRPWADRAGWVACELRKTWFTVASRSSSSRTVAETWFARGSMTEDELCITGLLELAAAMKDELG